MTSIVSICNLALGSIGKDAISSIDEASAEARACKTFYSICLDTALQAYPWSWAEETRALAEVTNTRLNRWLYAYQRPVDCLKVRALLDESLMTEQPAGAGIVAGVHNRAISGQVIFCDLKPAYLSFTKTFTDAAMFPPLFADALGMSLATRIAMPVTRDMKIRNDALTLSRQAMAMAQEADSAEMTYDYDHPSERIEARGSDYAMRRPAIV